MMRYNIFLWILLWVPLISFAKELTSIQIDAKNTTRIIFKGDVGNDAKIFLLKNPNRLVVDFQKTLLKTNLKKIFLSQKSHILKIREGYPKKDVLRIVLDLDGPVYFQKIKNSQFFIVELISDSVTHKGPYVGDSGGRAKLSIVPLKTLPQVVPPAPSRRLITGSKSASRRLTIVIDPGHGGKDPGAIGDHGTKEKDIVLGIAKKLAVRINQNPEMHAVLTREGDYYISLRRRLLLARQNKADLFIAIHADSYFNKRATGASVYLLSEHGATSMAARWLASRENHSELGDVDFGELEDQSIQLRSVLIDLAKTETIKESLLWGKSMLNALDDVTKLHYASVERAPFLVLKSPDIPSILVETGFISNQNEEKRLRDEDHQHKIALALYNGIRGYSRFVPLSH